MKQKLFILLLSILSCGLSFGQATIKGKVTDDKGESLIGVIVMLKGSSTVATTTDLDGAFTLKLASQKVQVVQVSYIGFQTIIDTLFLKTGEERIKDYILNSQSTEIKDVEVIGRAKKSDDKYMENVKAKSVSTIDFISSATMKRTGDASVVAAVGRVSGVSTNGAFITVRGIGDRYVKTTINGMRIPTLDPLTNNIKLDMFPSSLVDNIVLVKTPSADLPGDWAGAYLSVETKDYPDKLMVNVESQFGFNNQTTFKNILSSDRSKTDWLGYDDGMRSYDHNSFVATNPDPSEYDLFVALGYSDYLKSLGITNANTWGKNSDSYYKDVLVQMGLLDKSVLTADPTNKIANKAFSDAKQSFNTLYYNKAFDAINEKAVASNKAFPTINAKKVYRNASLNNSQSFSIGNQTILFKKTLGYLIGFKYSHSIQYDPNSFGNRETSFIDITQSFAYDSLYRKNSKETNGWSGLANMAYAFNRHNKVSLLFMPNIIGVNDVKDVETVNQGGNGLYFPANSTKVFYEQRKQFIYQFKSEHYIPGSKIKIDCNASYTDGSSSVPNYKNVGYPTGSFRYLGEKLFDSKIAVEVPIMKNSELSRKIKFGGSYQRNDRKSDQYSYGIGTSVNGADSSGQLFGISPQGGDFKGQHKVFNWLKSDDSPINHAFGYSTVAGGYSMIDYTISPSIRLSSGLRIEKAIIYTDINKFDSLKLAPNDKRRKIVGDQYNEGLLIKSGSLDKLSLLPSIALIYKIRKEESSPINLKLNFAQTVARPSIRELMDMRNYDFETNMTLTGNPNLKMVQANNYDIRLEFSSKSGDNISMNLFYKDFLNHIELTDFGPIGAAWINGYKKAYLKGLEFEGKKTLFKHLECRGNVTFVNSQSTLIKHFERVGWIPYNGDTVTHTMFGQAPYIINAMISYSSDSLKMSVSLSYNIQGSRLVLVGGNKYTPDVYERPRQLLDGKVTKGLGKHFSASFTVKDILNAAVRRTYKFKNTWLEDYDVYHWGTTYNFALSYKL
jgi:hypothetical protein